MINLTVTYTPTQNWQRCFDAMWQAAEFYYRLGIRIHPRVDETGFTWKRDNPHVYFRDKPALAGNMLGVAVKSYCEVAVHSAEIGKVVIHELGHVLMHDDGHESGTFMHKVIEQFDTKTTWVQRRKLRRGAEIWSTG